ncbi:MAG TPA: NAD-dependent epimerase/dehydratase family protein [Methanothermobacter sp.]|jgi:nucleoside-diphosphate-sugar epimerase|uniref:Nucleotide sugar epimerase n=1 Tax=Methanothermobacter tenebrarum TaxID=680118 RepID=A0ABM7YDT7_9EURY|nr:NAD-dependent epimerase/dehydratase family protein [Methanothermobacter tenebrarum]MDI6881603.1 NAD-dependent epimerase/dehydratase family protein [Methanothermobacter sp.]MDX9693555.1 NAD-dependent epimerase/dehydratase family protein [Methanothermobacter sp.]BDH79426.1 nucleotide sugar epimerase [Methanothermobacter tenebrarum]HHW16053.1 NAD-dependent epimerase/dehydratase family protein [Methanothermobacter sp.]
MEDIKVYDGKCVLVTGGAGCIGSNLSRRLGEAGAHVIILDNLSSGYEWNIPVMENIEFIRGDILDDEILKRVYKERPDYVFHLAAHFANQNSVDHPEEDLLVNGLGTLKVLEYAQLIGVERFIYSSSGCGVYGLDSKIPFKEDDISISLHTPYQVTKLLGELYTNYFHNLYDLPIVNARFFNVYGPGEVPGKYRNVIPNFFYWAMNNQPLPITGDGTETRDWTFVDDIINGLIAMGAREKAIGEAINLGSGEEHQVIEMANIINELTGNKAGIVYKPRREWDAKTRLLSSIEKAKKLLDYEPMTTFREGLEKTHQWFKENWELIQESAEF